MPLSVQIWHWQIRMCPVPADEAIEAMYRVGKQLPRELRETALGGIAESETGKRIADEIRNQ